MTASPWLLIDVHGVFRALDEGFQQPDLIVQHGGGIFLAPAHGAGRDVVTGGAPLLGVLDAVDAQAEEAHRGLEHAGAGQAVEMRLHDVPQGQLAEMEIREERGQALAEQQLVLEQFGGAHQSGIARTAVEPVQGVFRIAVQALPLAAQTAEVAAGDKVEVQPVIQPGLPGSGRIQDGFLPVGGKGGQLRRDIRIFQNDHGPLVQHGCVKSAGPGCFLTLRGVVAGEAPGTPPRRERLRQWREMSHGGTGFPAEPGTTIGIKHAGGRRASPCVRFC